MLVKFLNRFNPYLIVVKHDFLNNLRKNKRQDALQEPPDILWCIEFNNEIVKYVKFIEKILT